MPSDKTFVTEVVTGLGMIGLEDLDETIDARPSSVVNLTGDDWERLETLRAQGHLGPEFFQSFLNGRAFLLADGALAGRIPRRVEWTGGRRPPGDEVVPADLRIDHVYLVSCKYLSRILHNLSPARLVVSLLGPARSDEPGDWFSRCAPREYQALYERCRSTAGLPLPDSAEALSSPDRRLLSAALRAGWPPGAASAYEELCQTVAAKTADRWRRRLDPKQAEVMLWRLLRIGSSPYFILGTSAMGATHLRIDTPWDWRQRYRLEDFAIAPRTAGQPLVSWSAHYLDRTEGSEREVHGHVEIRWSHGRFAQPPEAKVYLDSPICDVPGYHEI